MKVILFDGVCNLCNGFVNWIIDHDIRNEFKFASLQSSFAQAISMQSGITGNYPDTVVLVDNGKAFLRSTAVLIILRQLGFPYSLAYGFIIVPLFIRDAVYNWVARNRYKWFGKRNVCRVPEPGIKAKFIE